MKKEETVKLFLEIASRKEKKIIKSTPDTFYYGSWYSDVIRFDENGLCHVRLRDLARHSDFYDFIMEMQSEKGFEIIVSDTISLGYCEWLLGNEYKGIAFTEEKWGWAPESDKYKMEVIKQIALDLNSRLSNYSLVIEDAKLCVKATNDALKQGIINKNPSFIEDMERVKAYIGERKEEIIQELRPAAKAWKKEQWYKETLTGKVAKKLKEIISPRGEHIVLKIDLTTNTYLDGFEYKGRELKTWDIYPYSEVGDYDIGPAVHCVGLEDLAVCSEFLQAVRAVEEEERFRFQVAASISLNDCFTIAGRTAVDFAEIAKRLNVENGHEIDMLLVRIWDELKEILEPEFHIMINYIRHEFFLGDVYGIRQEDVIGHSALFLEKINKVADSLERYVHQLVKNLIENT